MAREKQTITAADVGTVDAASLVKPKKSKYPLLEKSRDELEAQKAEITAKSKALREERQELREKITPALDRLRELDKEIHAIEQPQLRQINNQLTGIYKVIGAKAVDQ